MLCTIDPAGSQEFLGTYQPEVYTQLVTNQVLTTITSCHTQITGTV